MLPSSYPSELFKLNTTVYLLHNLRSFDNWTSEERLDFRNAMCPCTMTMQNGFQQHIFQPTLSEETQSFQADCRARKRLMQSLQGEKNQGLSQNYGRGTLLIGYCSQKIPV